MDTKSLHKTEESSFFFGPQFWKAWQLRKPRRTNKISDSTNHRNISSPTFWELSDRLYFISVQKGGRVSNGKLHHMLWWAYYIIGL